MKIDMQKTIWYITQAQLMAHYSKSESICSPGPAPSYLRFFIDIVLSVNTVMSPDETS